MRDRSGKPVKVAEIKGLETHSSASVRKELPPADLERIARRAKGPSSGG